MKIKSREFVSDILPGTRTPELTMSALQKSRFLLTVSVLSAIATLVFVILSSIKLNKAKIAAAAGNTNVGAGTTAATAATPNLQLGLWNANPSLNYIPYTPSSMNLLAVGDYKGDDISSVVNVTLDSAVTQMPLGSVGFVFVVSDNSLITSASVGTAYYKSLIDQQAVANQILFRTVSGASSGSTKIQYLPGYAQQLNNIGVGTGTLKQAITIATQNQNCAGFGWTPNSTVGSPLNDTDTGIFQLKTAIHPTTNTDLFCFTYVLSTYQVPTHVWNDYVSAT